MDIENSAKSSLQEALEIAAQIIAGENAALMERIGQLEQRLESMNETMLAMQMQMQQMQQGMVLMPESKVAVEVDAAVVQDAAADVQDAAADGQDDAADGQDDAFDMEEVSVGEEESIPDSMVGLGVLPFANELIEKANEAAAGSDVFELMARNEKNEEETYEDEIGDMLATDETDDLLEVNDLDNLLEVKEADSIPKILNEAAKPDWFDWEVDYPASYVDDVFRAISFNDRYEFIKELVNISGDLGEAEVLFKDTLDDINEMETFKQVVEYIRRRFPQWDEQSDEVYRFYMAIRRKFNKQ